MGVLAEQQQPAVPPRLRDTEREDLVAPKALPAESVHPQRNAERDDARQGQLLPPGRHARRSASRFPRHDWRVEWQVTKKLNLRKMSSI